MEKKTGYTLNVDLVALENLIITTQKNKNSKNYYILETEDKKLILKENNTTHKKVTVYDLEKQECTINDQRKGFNFVKEFQARLHQISRDIESGKAEVYEKVEPKSSAGKGGK